MNEETKKIIEKQLAGTPKEVREVIASSGWEKKLIEIGRKRNLREDQLGNLQMETLLVMLGLTHPDGFYNEIRKRLKLGEEETENLVLDVGEEILRPIRKPLTESINKQIEEFFRERDEKEIKEEKISREDILRGIEELPSGLKQAREREKIKGLVEEKMGAPFKLEKEETDYSLDRDRPKFEKHDPYREPTK